MVGLPVLGEVTDHGVSDGPAHDAFSNLFAIPGIETCLQQSSFLPGLIGECLVHWQCFLRRQFTGLHKGAVLLGAFWALLSPDRMDFLFGFELWVCVLVCIEDLANAGEGVLSMRVFLPFFVI